MSRRSISVAWQPREREKELNTKLFSPSRNSGGNSFRPLDSPFTHVPICYLLYMYLFLLFVSARCVPSCRGTSGNRTQTTTLSPFWPSGPRPPTATTSGPTPFLKSKRKFLFVYKSFYGFFDIVWYTKPQNYFIL